MTKWKTETLERLNWILPGIAVTALAASCAVHLDNRKSYRESQALVVVLQQELGVTQVSLRDRIRELADLRARVAELERQQTAD